MSAWVTAVHASGSAFFAAPTGVAITATPSNETRSVTAASIACAWLPSLRTATITHPVPYLRGGENSFRRVVVLTPDGQERQNSQEHRRRPRPGLDHGPRRGRRAPTKSDAQVSSTYDASIDSTIADIQAYWTTTMPDVYGQQYDAIPADRVFPYSQSNPPPNCDDGGQTKAPYQDVAGNAFYCSNGDFVAYDEQGLLPKLRANFGEFAVGLVFAHELGHTVQARVGYQPSATVYMEQQADCFAGSWAQHVADSQDSNVHLSSSDLDTALAGLLT